MRADQQDLNAAACHAQAKLVVIAQEQQAAEIREIRGANSL